MNSSPLDPFLLSVKDLIYHPTDIFLLHAPLQRSYTTARVYHENLRAKEVIEMVYEKPAYVEETGVDGMATIDESLAIIPLVIIALVVVAGEVVANFAAGANPPPPPPPPSPPA